MDYSYFGGSASGKRGHVAASKSTVVVAVENCGPAAGYAAMKVIESMHSKHLIDFAFRHYVGLVCFFKIMNFRSKNNILCVLI